MPEIAEVTIEVLPLIADNVPNVPVSGDVVIGIVAVVAVTPLTVAVVEPLKVAADLSQVTVRATTLLAE